MFASSPRFTPASLGLVCALGLSVTACQRADSAAAAASSPTPVAQPSTAPVASPDVAQGPVMRTYEAPMGRGQELANVLQRVLSQGKDIPPLGKATVVDGDHVLVVAPPGMHEGVESLCLRMKEQGPSSLRSVEIDYWLVRADPAQTSDTSEVSEIADALTEVAAQTGEAKFSLFERASLTSMLDAHGRTRGEKAEFSQVATASERGVVADINIDLGMQWDFNKIETRLAIEPGKTIVIGQNGMGGNTDGVRLFYVVRAELVDAA